MDFLQHVTPPKTCLSLCLIFLSLCLKTKRTRTVTKHTESLKYCCRIFVVFVDDPVVHERENAARRDLHSDPVVHERENAARRELHLDLVVHERKDAACQELCSDPVVHKRENAALFFLALE